MGPRCRLGGNHRPAKRLSEGMAARSVQIILACGTCVVAVSWPNSYRRTTRAERTPPFPHHDGAEPATALAAKRSRDAARADHSSVAIGIARLSAERPSPFVAMHSRGAGEVASLCCCKFAVA
jgi:hypothetical protein